MGQGSHGSSISATLRVDQLVGSVSRAPSASTPQFQLGTRSAECAGTSHVPSPPQASIGARPRESWVTTAKDVPSVRSRSMRVTRRVGSLPGTACHATRGSTTRSVRGRHSGPRRPCRRDAVRRPASPTCDVACGPRGSGGTGHRADQRSRVTASRRAIRRNPCHATATRSPPRPTPRTTSCRLSWSSPPVETILTVTQGGEHRTSGRLRTAQRAAV